ESHWDTEQDAHSHLGHPPRTSGDAVDPGWGRRLRLRWRVRLRQVLAHGDSGVPVRWVLDTVGALDITKVYLMLPVQNMDRALAFCRDVFGLTVRFTSPDWSELAWRDATIALHGGSDGTPRESWLGFSVDDLDAALAAVEAAGGQIGTERQEGGVRLVSVTDPEGNGLTVGQHADWS